MTSEEREEFGKIIERQGWTPPASKRRSPLFVRITLCLATLSHAAWVPIGIITGSWRWPLAGMIASLFLVLAVVILDDPNKDQ